jgi:DNA-binding beta-propeller fold protein YncE
MRDATSSPERTRRPGARRERLTRSLLRDWCRLDAVRGTLSAATLGLAALGLTASAAPSAGPRPAPVTSTGWLAPSAVAVTPDGQTVVVVCAQGRKLLVLDARAGKVIQALPLGAEPSGVVLARDGRRLYVTCAGPQSQVGDIDLPLGLPSAPWRTGHTATSPVLSADGATLYVCLRFEDQIAAFDLRARRETGRIPVGREPVSAAATRDGRFLLVAHHLPSGRAEPSGVAATIGVVDLAAAKMVRELRLPNGSTLLRQIEISPDGRYAAVPHNLARYQVPTTQLERGWMNTSALTLVSIETQEILDTVLLDEVDRGAANPWAIAWTPDGHRLLVTHAGTHELSLIDFPALLAKLARVRGQRDPDPAPADDLAFLVDLRQRLRLAGNGPRSLAVAGQTVWIADYFSDTVESVELGAGAPSPRAISLSASAPASPLRDGEALFNDASICFQGWQSCATCHSEDARVDGLNWDLLNDGIGNPKNTKSLLLSHATPPAMSTGVRYTTEAAVRAGIQHILFATPSEKLAAPMDRWLKSLKPLPSPHRIDGRLSPAARRGQRVFKSTRTGCAVCHPPPLFTDLKAYDVGSAGPTDQDAHRFDTPTLVELWRTAPYLHDGSAATLRDVLTGHNAGDRHGRVAHLSDRELDDLIEFLLSL